MDDNAGEYDGVGPLIEAHVRLQRLLDRLSEAVDKLQSGDATAYHADDVIAQLGPLLEYLEQHFEAEEESGVHEQFVELMPDVQKIVSRLYLEHREALRSLEELREFRCNGSPDRIKSFGVQVGRLVNLLYEHEALEDELVTKTLRRCAD
jgi:hemerythrin-like domain-containing protein